MDTESKTYVFGNEGGTVPAWMAMNNGGFGGFNGNTIGDLIGLAIVASIFGWNGGNGFDRPRFGFNIPASQDAVAIYGLDVCSAYKTLLNRVST